MNTQTAAVRAQYEDDRNLNARIVIHARFSTNPYSWSRWVLDQFSFPAEAHILELGCGPGNLWTTNRRRIMPGWRVTLTDFSRGMVGAARANLGEEGAFVFSVADAQHIPYADNRFDAVMANHMLYHVPHRQHALNEIRRVLKPGGRFYATTVGESHMREMWDLLAPFIPDVYTRVNGVSCSFTLENGRAQLASVFDDVTVAAYPDDLEVTAVEPLIAYLMSSPTSIIQDLTAAQLDAIKQHVADHITAKGSFHIHKASGIFAAKKP